MDTYEYPVQSHRRYNDLDADSTHKSTLGVRPSSLLNSVGLEEGTQLENIKVLPWENKKEELNVKSQIAGWREGTQSQDFPHKKK